LLKRFHESIPQYAKRLGGCQHRICDVPREEVGSLTPASSNKPSEVPDLQAETNRDWVADRMNPGALRLFRRTEAGFRAWASLSLAADVGRRRRSRDSSLGP
jgi:hypothetical protein